MSVIKTQRLILRPFELSDLESTYHYASDTANIEYMFYYPHKTRRETDEFLKAAVAEWAKESPGFYEFAVMLGKNHIGCVSVYLADEGRQGELGWIIHKSYQGNGYATEAAKAVLDFAAQQPGIKKIMAHCDHRNEPSIRVAQKIGLVLESDTGLRRYKDSDEDIRELAYSYEVPCGNSQGGKPGA